MLVLKNFAKHIALVCLLAATLLLIASNCEEEKAEAHDRGDFLPHLPTWAQKQVMARGYGLYKLDARSSQMPGYRAAIWACYGDIIEKTGIEWYEQTDPNGPVDLLYTMPDIVFEPGVVGSAYYTNAPAFIQVNFRAGITSWGSTVCHEHGHIDGQEDLYKHPLTCDSTARFTVMSCGTFIGLSVDPYDKWVKWNTYIPDIMSRASISRNSPGSVTLTYNGLRMSSVNCIPYALVSSFNGGRDSERDNYCGHYSPNLDNATRVAIFRSVGGGDWSLVGYGPVPTGSANTSVTINDDPGCGGIRYGLRPESALPATWLGRVPYMSGDMFVLNAP
jgi:hypothetical protein